MSHTVSNIGLTGAEHSVDQLTAIIELVPTAMIIVNDRGQIVLLNKEAELLFGYDHGELSGNLLETIVPEEFRSDHPGLRTAFFAEPSKRRMGVGRDLHARRKDGSIFPVEIGLHPINTDKGILVVSTVVDITERKNLEARFRATVESAPTAMVMIDRTGCIVLVNAETEKLFGYTRHELLGKSMEILVPQEFRAHHPELRDSFFSFPQARRMGVGRDLYAQRKDGNNFPVEIGLNPIETSEGIFVLSAIVDITDRKRLEATLRQTNELLEDRIRERTKDLAQQAFQLQELNRALEQSNMELQQFASIASHDLQSPLRSISGFVQLLQLECAGKLDDRASDWIQRTVRAVQQMQTLINDLLTYSRVESEASPFQSVVFREVIDETLGRLGVVLRESAAQIICSDLPTVKGDRSQLVQLMQNLIDNAIKYHNKETPVIHISASRNENGWTFSVQDDGIGIDQKYHERIFEIFRRLHNQQEYSGTGIGLAVCRRVVQRHGGHIWLESSPGEGSTFYFTIPDY